jgi:hypothetical protein
MDDNQLLDQLKSFQLSLTRMNGLLADLVSSSKKGGRPPPKGPKGPYNPGPPLPRAPPLPQPKKPWQPKRTTGQYTKYCGVQKAGSKSPKRGGLVSPRPPRSKKAWKKRQGRGVKTIASLPKLDVKEVRDKKSPVILLKEKADAEVEAFLEQISVPFPV